MDPMATAAPETGPVFPWQLPLWTQFGAARRRDRLAHAYLLAGPPGVGKRILARRIAASVLCRSPLPDDGACGRCSDCLLLEAETHPDLAVVEPESGKTQIAIEAVRALCADLTQTAHQGGMRVALIVPAEAMTPQSANSLLKTLEEPHGRVLLILISDRPLAVLPTLRSRCQRLDCPIPSQDVVRRWLGRERADERRLLRAFVVSGGAPLHTRLYLDDAQAQRLDRLAQDSLQVITGAADPLSVAARWVAEEAPDLMGLWMVRLAEEMTRTGVLGHGPAPVLLDLDPLTLQRTLARADSEDVLAYVAFARQARLWLVQGTAHRQGLVESLLIPLADGLRAFRLQNPCRTSPLRETTS